MELNRLIGRTRQLFTAGLIIAFSSMAAVPVAHGSNLLLATYYGNQGFNMQQVRDMEAWQGKKNAAIMLFQSFCSNSMTNLFGTQLPAIWANKNVPLITWEPYLCDASSTPSDIEARIANGQYDSYVKAFADNMRRFLAGPDGVLGTGDDRRVFIRLAHEMNGTWYPWSGSPAQYIGMWHRVHQIFDARGLGSRYVQWMWVPNVGDVGSYTAEQYYPGDAYVNWVGTDGYNSYTTGVWKTPAQRFDAMLARLAKLTTRPIAIAEYGALSYTSTGTSVSTKNSWITSLFSYASSKPNVHMLCYYNRDSSSSKDWAVFGGGRGDTSYSISGRTYKVYTGYRTGARQTNVFATSTTNSRLLSDGQFVGSF